MCTGHLLMLRRHRHEQMRESFIMMSFRCRLDSVLTFLRGASLHSFLACTLSTVIQYLLQLISNPLPSHATTTTQNPDDTSTPHHLETTADWSSRVSPCPKLRAAPTGQTMSQTPNLQPNSLRLRPHSTARQESKPQSPTATMTKAAKSNPQERQKP